jgi:hypothetical protein
MKKSLIIIPLAVIAASLLVARAVHNDYYKHPEPPPGFKIACDGQGHYAVRTGCGFTFGDDMGGKPFFNSRQAAINRAWGQYEYENSGKDERVQEKAQQDALQSWGDCD